MVIATPPKNILANLTCKSRFRFNRFPNFEYVQEQTHSWLAIMMWLSADGTVKITRSPRMKANVWTLKTPAAGSTDA
jgi:hypothetical protein